MRVSLKTVETLWNNLSVEEREVLVQLTTVVWDGNLISKFGRDRLYEKNLIHRWNGFQVVSGSGLAVLEMLGKLKSFTR